MKNMIKIYLSKNWIEISKEQEEKFKKFLCLFQEENKKINLSAIKKEKDIIKKHFLDSLIISKFINLKWRILDLWTWWWLPWIPLKIFYGCNIKIDLLDSINKKWIIVKKFIKELNLDKINMIVKRAEEIWQQPKYKSKYNFVVSRATAYLSTLLEYCIPLLKVWWKLICYKIDNKQEIKDSSKAIKELKSEIINIKKYKIDSQERCLIFIKKIEETPKKYPRNLWIPIKKPIY